MAARAPETKAKLQKAKALSHAREREELLRRHAEEDRVYQINRQGDADRIRYASLLMMLLLHDVQADDEPDLQRIALAGAAVLSGGGKRAAAGNRGL